MTKETKNLIWQLVLIVLFLLFMYFVPYYMWKTACENRWWDKWKYVGVVWWCLIKTKQGYIPEDRLYNLNSLENNQK